MRFSINKNITVRDNETGKEIQFESLSQLQRLLKKTQPSSFFLNLDLVQKQLEMEGNNVISDLIDRKEAMK